MNFCRNSQDAPVPLQYFSGEQPNLDGDSRKDLWIRTDSSLKFHFHVREIAGKASDISCGILSGCICRTQDFMNGLHFVYQANPGLCFCAVVNWIIFACLFILCSSTYRQC